MELYVKEKHGGNTVEVLIGLVTEKVEKVKYRGVTVKVPSEGKAYVKKNNKVLSSIFFSFKKMFIEKIKVERIAPKEVKVTIFFKEVKK
ncbi:MAG: hypothetical protein PHD51_01370 [Patescibacteria group bacterium]|nr:hypothetical protein [Patescibacteria group bacterium]MDD5490489.1 hypothetical protein [Patescibacteria group bacterium]